MLMDASFDFTPSAQSLSGTSDQNSTNVFNAGSAKKLFGGAFGRGPKIFLQVTAIGGTSPTFRARLVAADSADLATNPIILADTGVSRVLAASDIPYINELLPSVQLDAKQYYGIIFTQSGTSPTATVRASLVADSQTAGLR